jgi:hypothetical protein
MTLRLSEMLCRGFLFGFEESVEVLNPRGVPQFAQRTFSAGPAPD